MPPTVTQADGHATALCWHREHPLSLGFNQYKCINLQADLEGERKDLSSLCVRLHRQVQRNDNARTEFLMRRTGGALLVARLINTVPTMVTVVENASQLLLYVSSANTKSASRMAKLGVGVYGTYYLKNTVFFYIPRYASFRHISYNHWVLSDHRCSSIHISYNHRVLSDHRCVRPYTYRNILEMLLHLIQLWIIMGSQVADQGGDAVPVSASHTLT